MLIAVPLLLVGCQAATSHKGTVEKEVIETEQQHYLQDKRDLITDTAEQTLQTLYELNPKAKSTIENAQGYAVFSNVGLKVFVAGAGTGHGVVVNNQSSAKTFMKMVELQAGLGFGIKKFQLVFVFANRQVLDDFVNSGWQFGGQASASLKTKDKGHAFEHAVSVSEGLWLYQITEKGLALDLTLSGAKFYLDDELN